MYVNRGRIPAGIGRARLRSTRDRRMGIAVAVIAPVLINGLKSLFGGIHGESYDTVEMESVYNAALGGDWGRVTAVSLGQPTSGLPYQNSDGKGGWASGGSIDWGQPGYATVRTFAGHLVQAFTAGINLPTPTTPSNRNWAGLQAEIAKLGNSLVSLPTVANNTPTGNAATNAAMAAVQAAVQSGALPPSVLQSIQNTANDVSNAARSAQGARTGGQVGARTGAVLASIPQSAWFMLLGTGVAVFLSRRKR